MEHHMSSISKSFEPGDENTPKSSKKLHEPFQLPINYLDKSHIHSLSPVVASDLEMETSQSESKSMYEILFRPKHQFAKNMIMEWKNAYTNHIPYLEDTQRVLKEMPNYVQETSSIKHPTDYEKLMEIWDATKNDDFFMEKYSYIDWSMLRYLNDSSSFLQGLSMIHIISPILSLLLPFFFLLIPFFLLKIRNVPVTFSMYLEILKNIARNHIIGKAIMSMEGGMSPDKIAYVLLTIGFYGLQIYQNVTACMRFYRNVNRVNDYLFHMREYVNATIQKMETFVGMHRDKPTYSDFCNQTEQHCFVLRQFAEEISSINPFSHNLGKMGEIGYMLKCFYHLHENEEYEKSLRYSFGFEGYIDNLAGVYENLVNGDVHYANFDSEKPTKFVEQYYPPFVGSGPVTNTCKFDKNMIISAPNAAGKTTLLKTTSINIIFSQQMGCGFYNSCVLNPYTHIHSYLNIPDTSGRDSLFQAESRRCKEIIDIVHSNGEENGSRHFCIFDELYSGTNPKEAGKSAYAFLKYLSKFEHVDFMLTTHYVFVCNKFKKSKRIRNYKMDVENIPKELGGGFKYTYLVKPGISKIEGAINILKEMNYPKELLDNIEECK